MGNESDNKTSGQPGSDAGQEKQTTQNDNGSAGSGGEAEVTLESLQKEMQGMQSVMGKWGNEVGQLRDFKEKFAELETKITSFAEQKPKEKKDELPIELSAEDEQKINDRWKAFDPEKREQMIEEAEGSTRQEKIQNVRFELSRLYVEEGQSIPDELFPTNPDASIKGKTKRATTNLTSIGRQLLGIKEKQTSRGAQPFTGPSGGRTAEGSSQQTVSRRGSLSGGLGGLGSSK